MGGLLHLVQQGGNWMGLQPAQALLTVPNVTDNPSMASVPITVLLYNGLLHVTDNGTDRQSENILASAAYSMSPHTKRLNANLGGCQ